ncbi:MAG: hypothetical protein FJ109_05040 [Deltaproteobacteria bacterium]|nr:hypothetical protein [Deltaproteobacteria bacterium]
MLTGPFLVTSAGYGIYVESDWPGTWHVADSDPGVLSVEYEGDIVDSARLPGARAARRHRPLCPGGWAAADAAALGIRPLALAG